MIKFDVCKSGCYCNLKTIFCHFLILVSFRVNPPSALQWTVFVGCKVMYVILRLVIPYFVMPWTSLVS